MIKFFSTFSSIGLQALTDKIINNEVYAKEFFATDVSQKAVLQRLSEKLISIEFANLRTKCCNSCGREVAENLKNFLDALIGTLLLGLQKRINNMFLDDYMTRKMSRAQKSQLKHGHKEKVFNPNPIPSPNMEVD